MEEHYITGLNLAHYPCIDLVTSRVLPIEGIYRPLNRLVANGRSCLNDGVVVFAKRRPERSEAVHRQDRGSSLHSVPTLE